MNETQQKIKQIERALEGLKRENKLNSKQSHKDRAKIIEYRDLKKELSKAKTSIDKAIEVLDGFIPDFTDDFKGWSAKYKFYYDEIESYKIDSPIILEGAEEAQEGVEEAQRLAEALNIVDYWDGIPSEEDIDNLKRDSGQDVLDDFKEFIPDLITSTTFGEVNNENTRKYCYDAVNAYVEDYLRLNNIKGEYEIRCDHIVNKPSVVNKNQFCLELIYNHNGFETEEGRKVFRKIHFLLEAGGTVKMAENV